MRYLRQVLAILVLTSFSAFGWCATTNQAVAPIGLGLDSQNGDSGDNSFINPPSERWQLFEAKALPWSGPVSIVGMAFRVDGGQPAMSVVIPRLEIRMSTSSRTAASMASFYPENVGPDETLVFGRDNVAVTSSGGPGPNPFGISFEFERPFTFDSANGSLLIKLNNPGFSFGGQVIDAQSGTSFAFFAPGITQTQLGRAQVTEFQWLTIPEPSSLLLFLLGWVAVASRHNKK